MAEFDAGVLPVGDDDRLIGMITDRDIAIRGVAKGKGPDTPVREVMSRDVKYCFDDQEIEDVARNMADIQVRRLPVVEPRQAAGRHHFSWRYRHGCGWTGGRGGPRWHLNTGWPAQPKPMRWAHIPLRGIRRPSLVVPVRGMAKGSIGYGRAHRSMERSRVHAFQRIDQNLANQRGSKPKVGLIREAAARRRRANHTNTLPSDTETLSATGAAAVQFTGESAVLSEPQKDRVAEIIAVLDKMNERERNLVKALVSGPFADWPGMPARLLGRHPAG